MNILEDILSNQKQIKEFFNTPTYKRQNPYQKEKILIEFFHSKNWDRILPENRIYLLQEFENMHAKKLRRQSYQIIVLNENYKFNELLMDFGTRSKDRKLLIRRNLLEEGIKQNRESDGTIVKAKIDFLNIFLLDNILHEG